MQTFAKNNYSIVSRKRDVNRETTKLSNSSLLISVKLFKKKLYLKAELLAFF